MCSRGNIQVLVAFIEEEVTDSRPSDGPILDMSDEHRAAFFEA